MDGSNGSFEKVEQIGHTIDEKTVQGKKNDQLTYAPRDSLERSVLFLERQKKNVWNNLVIFKS